MSIVRVWKPSARSSSSRRSRKAGQRKPLAASSRRQGRRYIVFDVDATRQAARQRALPCDPTLPAAKRRLDAVCAPGYRGRKRGEVVRTRTTALQMHTRQWVGTYAGKGNGDYRGELASVLRAITAYLKHFAFPPEMALVRLDGAYGDATVVAQLLLAGTPFVTRWRGYLLLKHPQRKPRAGSCTDGEDGEDEQRCGRRVV